MKSVVLGKVIEKTYFVEPNTETITIDGEEKVVYKSKPVMKEESKIKEWKEICHFDGKPRYNHDNRMWKAYFASSSYDNYCFNISEDETVCIEKEIFRADLNELHLKSDKVLEKIEVDKENSTYEYESHVEQFNKMMNTSNKLMKDYCDLHGLDYRKADCEKVFSLVYPDKEYEIKDGKMDCRVVYTATTLCSGYAIGSHCHTATISGCVDALSSTISACTSNIDCTIRV